VWALCLRTRWVFGGCDRGVGFGRGRIHSSNPRLRQRPDTTQALERQRRIGRESRGRNARPKRREHRAASCGKGRAYSRLHPLHGSVVGQAILQGRRRARRAYAALGDRVLSRAWRLLVVNVRVNLCSSPSPLLRSSASENARARVHARSENVSMPTTRQLLEELRARDPDRVAFATLDAVRTSLSLMSIATHPLSVSDACACLPLNAQQAEFGAAQTRIRLIAGPPRLIKILQEMPSARRLSVRNAFAAHGLDVPAPCFKNQTIGYSTAVVTTRSAQPQTRSSCVLCAGSRNGIPCLRSVEAQSHTVCACALAYARVILSQSVVCRFWYEGGVRHLVQQHTASRGAHPTERPFA
jgi:hypothetical protein